MSSRFFEEASHAALYIAFRPNPPSQLVKKIVNFLKEKVDEPLTLAADVGCGSGQSTYILTRYFQRVTGLDVSQAQIEQAQKRYNIDNMVFKTSPAEILPFENNSVQLVTACQACHWFDLPKFYKEVDRILVPNGVLAFLGYTFPRPQWGDVSDQLAELIDNIYNKDTKGLWGSGRKEVDDRYTDPKFIIPYLDFVRDDSFAYEQIYTVREVQGYISTWSGFQKYMSIHGKEAAQKLLDDFLENFMAILNVSTTPEETKLILRFPFFLLMGRKPAA